MKIQTAIREIVEGRDLAEEDVFQVAVSIMDGEAEPCQIAALLVAMRMKGETVEEITGFVRAMRAKVIPVPVAVEGLIDTCGTGGDGAGTFNISTVSAFVAAGAGCKVAKHGNRSVSSRCGSAEVLEALGVEIEETPERTARLIEEIGMGFLFAPMYHKATRHAVVPRRAIGVRSIFNIVGPLTHPAGARRQVIGVFDAALTEPLAHVLQRVGSEHCMVLHGQDGLDEITLDGPTRVTELKDGTIRTWT
ncbi:MAG: anthranilate phosphoribosyltransferase, partial [Phycisphaerae bacterium]